MKHMIFLASLLAGSAISTFATTITPGASPINVEIASIPIGVPDATLTAILLGIGLICLWLFGRLSHRAAVRARKSQRK
ncbi:MAG: hypothetical protein ABSE16_11200 [Verrucomicrobiota bacterium]